MPVFPNKPSTGGSTTSLPWTAISDKPAFATVATTGAYSDLQSLPTTMAGFGITDGMTLAAMSSALSSYATTSSMTSALSSYATTASMSGYVSNSALATTLTSYATTSSLTSSLSGKYNTPSGTTLQYVRGDGSLATFPGLFDGSYASLSGKPTYATVATSGSYADLSNKPTILNVLIGSPAAKLSPALTTSYQATDPTKATLVTVNITSTSSISLGGTTNNEGGIWIGSANTVNATTGTQVGVYKNSLGGTLVVGLTLTSAQTQPYSFVLPVGWYYAIRQTVGTGMTIVSVFDQSLT